MYVLNERPQTNVVEYFLSIGLAKCTRASPLARKMSLFSSNLKCAEFSGYVHVFRFRPQIPFFGKFGSKNQNCWFILKFGTWTNSNLQNSMAIFNFSAFDWNYPF